MSRDRKRGYHPLAFLAFLVMAPLILLIPIVVGLYVLIEIARGLIDGLLARMRQQR